MAQGDSDQNLLISPLSVFLSMSMLLNGASGHKQDELAVALGLGDMPVKEINYAGARLLKSLQTSGLGIKLGVANSLWVREGVLVRKEFIRDTVRFYHTPVISLDFADPTALTRINSWAKTRTNGMIPQVISDIEPDEFLILLSTVFLRGKCTHRFDRRKTRDDKFYVTPEKQKVVPFMRQSQRFAFLDVQVNGVYLQAVRLPWGNSACMPFNSLVRKRS